MKLQSIDKARYRKHLNIVIAGFITTFALLSIVLGSLLISIFSTENEQRIIAVVTQNAQLENSQAHTNDQNQNQNQIQNPIQVQELNSNIVQAEPQSNFKYNVAGVVIALLCCGIILSKLEKTEFFKEIAYVRQLKQLHNLIYRRLTAIKSASKNNDVNALTILYFYYKTLQQVYELDDNTLVINKVIQDFNQTVESIEKLNLSINETDFSKDLIAKF